MPRTALVPLALFAAGCAAPALKPAPPPAPVDDGAPPTLRLPPDVTVQAERLDLDINPHGRSFHGVADLDLHLDRPRATLWIHGRELRVTRATIAVGSETWPATWTDRADAMAAVRADRPIPAGKVTVHLEYDADYQSSDVGVSRVLSEGRDYVFTELALVEARRAFPCLDEPSFKAPFTLTLDIPAEGDEAIANTAEAGRTMLPDGRLQVRFHETPRISPYLVAFAVGPFSIVPAADVPSSDVRPRPLPLRAITPFERDKHVDAALNIAARSVRFLEDYLHQPFPFEKLDLIAVPDKTGAMENPGAITFRESLLSLDDATASEGERRARLEVIAHEVAHQWLGDLVTPAWWDDLWLNEGFATWMSGKIASAIDPGRLVDLRLLEGVHEAMELDARAAVRRVRQPIRSADDIENALDDVTYEKGGAILGMFERSLGPEVFRDGVRRYVAAHAFGTATAEDLMTALSAAAGRDVSRSFHAFIEQPGVPRVDVQVSCAPAAKAHLTQSRYTLPGSSVDPHALWPIPICLAYGVDGARRETCATLDAAEGDVALDGCPSWLTPNADGAGYYRAELGHEALASTARHLDALSPRELVSLASDLNAGFVHGTTSAEDTFTTLAPLARDRHAEVVRTAFEGLAGVHDWLLGDPAIGAFEAYADALLLPAYRELGWDPRSSDAVGVREERTVVVDRISRVARDPAARWEAAARARRFLGVDGDGRIHPDAVDADLRATTLIVAAEDGDARLFDAIVAPLRAAESTPFRTVLLEALAAFRDPALASRARELTLTTTLHGAESALVLERQMRAPATRDGAFRWLEANVDRLLNRSQAAGVREWIVGDVQYMCDAAASRAIGALLDHVTPEVTGGPRMAAMALERAQSCAKQRATLLPAVKAFLAAHKPAR